MNKIERFEYRSFLKFKHCYQLLTKPDQNEKATVFVAGHQRSGTNMLMHVLDRSLQTDTYHERDTRAFHRYMMRDLSVIRKLHDDCRASHFVIKALCELQDLSMLMSQFSPARTVWIYRNFNDVVNSMMRSFDGYAEQFRRICEDRNSVSWRGRGMTDSTHSILRSLAEREISDESAAAMQWFYRNILFFEQGFDQNDEVLLVAYEDLVTAPEAEFPRICEFLDIDFTPRLSARVFSSSVQRYDPPKLDPVVRDHCRSLYERMQAVAAGQTS